MHRYLLKVRRVASQIDIVIDSNRETELSQISRGLIFDYIWRAIPKDERSYFLRLMGYANQPRNIHPFRYSILAATPLHIYDLTFYSRLPFALYGVVDPETRSPIPGNHLPWQLRREGAQLVKWLSDTTPGQGSKIVNVTMADNACASQWGLMHLPFLNQNAAQLKMQFRSMFISYLVAIKQQWRSYDGMYQCAFVYIKDRSRRVIKMKFTVVPNTEDHELSDYDITVPPMGGARQENATNENEDEIDDETPNEPDINDEPDDNTTATNTTANTTIAGGFPSDQQNHEWAQASLEPNGSHAHSLADTDSVSLGSGESISTTESDQQVQLPLGNVEIGLQTQMMTTTFQ
jgi:hypothetical protein